MSNKSKQTNSVLGELKSLVDVLTDRDVQIKRDFRLFEDFLENFPVPVSMWSANLSGEILTKRNKGFFCKEGNTLSEVFDCPSLCETIFDTHTRSTEKSSSILVQKSEKTYYVTVVPRRDDHDTVIGVSGIAWDVSSNNFILNTLMEIKSLTETKSGTHEDILKKVNEAIEKSQLFTLMNSGGNHVK